MKKNIKKLVLTGVSLGIFGGFSYAQGLESASQRPGRRRFLCRVADGPATLGPVVLEWEAAARNARDRVHAPGGPEAQH